MTSRRLLSQITSIKISPSVVPTARFWNSPRVAAKTTVSVNSFFPRVQNFTTSRAMESVAGTPDDSGVTYASVSDRLDPLLFKAIEKLGFDSMTPVQHRVMTQLQPNGWRGDCLVQAKTGTGKTVAFLLPVLHQLVHGDTSIPKGQVAVLIITPTRELALQIAKTCNGLTSQLPRRREVQCHVAVGGTARASAFNAFIAGDPKVLVATPGRLQDYLNDEECEHKFKNIQTVILDEADTMLEAGFLRDVRQILRKLPAKREAGWQGMCFSATVPPKVKDVINVVLRDGYHHISTLDPNESATHERVPQYSVVVPGVEQLYTALHALLKEEMKGKKSKKVIVFGATSNLVALMSMAFEKLLMGQAEVFEMHSRLSQSVRSRTTNQFREATSGVMFASDVVGRGLDFPNVDLVVQVGLPANSDQYVHRVGRTARAGNDGRAVMLLTERESFFIKVNAGKFPIQPHPNAADILAAAADPARSKNVVNRVMAAEVDEVTKHRAYSSYLGCMAGGRLLKQMRLDKPGLVQMANELAVKGFQCPEPPQLQKSVAGKMGLTGNIPGLRLTNVDPKLSLKGRQPAQNGARNHPPRDVLSPEPSGVEKPKPKPRAPFKPKRNGSWGKTL
ncbi:DEAD/DEAH box helicase [Aspergillus aculeatinus CBS 121060]|uniref:P-loop containing nucleoside triphosphate hydrolase protein n=1 Tax=Aspergillus aculeatinus CBS 121060 TaxID=1448322 RepID=A0ACD1GTM3_9EURO|nr:P-loop containing nucleoside triphosphate hydrolase protein [Aspergillus aculeatinus CBS 121060]RAH64619.1 P-loop containing nucleoside triphosphate hydrolase protein [Aspergillus aculeatinus CBS 121060]